VALASEVGQCRRARRLASINDSEKRYRTLLGDY
jgi:hypothetical protein